MSKKRCGKTAKILFFAILFSISFLKFSYGENQKQQVNVDSTFNSIKLLFNDVTKVEELISLYKISVKQKQIRADILDEALSVSEKISYLDGIAKCYNRKGITARKISDYSNSVIYHKRALTYFESSTDTLSKIKCLNSLGVTYRKLNLEKEAFKLYSQALHLAELFENNKSIAIALNGIGNVFLNIGEYDNALHYFRRGLEIENLENNPKGREYELANIGEVFLYKKDFDSAFYYLDKSLVLAKKYPRKAGEAIKYNLLGLLFQKKENYELSINYYKKAIPLFVEYQNVRYLSNTLINIGYNQLKLERYDLAHENINIGLDNALSINSKENIMLGYKVLTDYYTDIKDYKSALAADKKADIFHDSIINEVSQKSIISTQIEFETAKKDLEIKKLAGEKLESQKKAKNLVNRMIIIILISIVIVLLILLFHFQDRKKKDLQLEKRNSEIKTYIFQIEELEEIVKGNTSRISEEFTSKIKDFDLTKREIEVLEYIIKGYSNQEISQSIYLSKNTVKTHIQNIYSKLDVKSRIQALKKVEQI